MKEVMKDYIKKLPNKPSFYQKGFEGYKYSLQNRNIEISIIDSEKGHDTFIISKKCTHVYYILKGRGFFTINGKKYKVGMNYLVEVPPKVEYTYTGKMKIILIMNPPWFAGNEKITKNNPDVINQSKI